MTFVVVVRKEFFIVEEDLNEGLMAGNGNPASAEKNRNNALQGWRERGMRGSGWQGVAWRL